MQALKLNANQKRDLLRAVEGLPSAPSADGNDVVVLVIGQGQALVGRPKALGRVPKVSDLLRWVEAAVDGCSSEAAICVPAALTSAEAALLNDAGFDEGTPGETGALERSCVEYELLLRESLTLEEAAKTIGVTTSRLRQRLSPAVRSIYGIKNGRSWLIPRFQLRKDGKLLRNIEKVVPHIRPDAHPLAVKSWFSTPHVDLVAENNAKPVAPIAWLAAGRPAEIVASLAEEI